ncbi:MAG TPA: hypothetical protein P5234_13650 [Thermoanaerobaculaceae bacterium]|nr:hypothetical protein [Thermoanaerobaculaceae bacterium]HRS17275.1 hypothetical protein [Thermoanaerobaculaceae bacterium]
MSKWLKIGVSGNEQVLRGFLAGFRAAGGRRFLGAVLGSDVPLVVESLSEKLRRLLAAGSHHVVLAPATYAARLVRALEREGGTVGLAVRHQAEVAGARFAFRAETFNPDTAKELRTALLEGLPEGLELRDVQVEELRDETLRGAELYTPAHHYAWRVSGEAVGPLTAILEMHRRASSLDAATAEAVHLILG